MMSGAIEAATELRSDALAQHGALVKAIAAYRGAWLRLSNLGEADDLLDVFKASAALILAAEEIEETVKAVRDDARAALAKSMVTTGCPAFRTPAHTVGVAESARKVLIIDEAEIPADYMRQPPPKPDVAAIRTALKAGHSVPGAALSNSRTRYITFHAIKGDAP